MRLWQALGLKQVARLGAVQTGVPHDAIHRHSFTLERPEQLEHVALSVSKSNRLGIAIRQHHLI
ncbi:MAG TPA: hypothetical protein ACQGQF_06090 [Xylella fastidiosa subsp. pauca]